MTKKKTRRYAKPAGQKLAIRESYADVQNLLVGHLKLANGSITHSGTKGSVNEDNWIDLLRGYLPRRYGCDSGIVIDSEGNVSEQIDIVIFDPQYTPFLLSQQTHRYIPAEAVYAVIEAKPQIDARLLSYAGKKAASVRRLKRTSVDIVHAAGVAKAKPPFRIAAGIVAKKVAWEIGLGQDFMKSIGGLSGDKQLDFGCAADGAAFDRSEGGGNIQVHAGQTSVMWFLFSLLDRLQSLGTVPAIDWKAYASVLKSR